MIKKLDIPLILLATAGFLAPLIGGHVAIDAQAISPDSNPFLLGLLGGIETPTLSHAILALLCCASLVTMLVQRKILQVPNPTFGGLVMALLALILATVGYSSFRSVSIPAALEWLSYGVAMYAVVAVLGRQKGPMILLASIFAGCVVLALLGIQEFGAMKATEPNHRIFPQWMGPNAMAAMLVIGFFLGLGLAINAERKIGLVIAVGCVAIGTALFLTQSKGALLAMLVSMVFYAVILFVWTPRPLFKRAFQVTAATVAIIGVLVAAMAYQGKANGAPGSVSGGGSEVTVVHRLVDVSGSADQSVGFRKRLWATSIKLIERNPLGIGIDSFQYESGRPGLVTQTHFAHEAYLQLATEASPLAPILLLAALCIWTRLLFRGGAKLQGPQNVLRASVLTAVATVLMHSLVDSNFSYYGVGLVMFFLFGVGLLLSSDAVAPEFLPAVVRRTAAVGVTGLALFLLFLGYTEGERGQARGYMVSRTREQVEKAQEILESVRSSSPWDADAWYLSALSAPNAPDRLAYAKRTVELAPTTRNLRLLANVEADAGMFSQAVEALQRASDMDPYNLQTLKLLSTIQAKMGMVDDADKTLRRLVDVEKTGYFLVRSEPEMVPTETYWARIQLAANTTDLKEKISLLKGAVDGFKQYLSLTIPNVLRFEKESSGAVHYGSETPEVATQKMAEAAAASKDLAAAYRATADTLDADAADADAATFAKPLDLTSVK